MRKLVSISDMSRHWWDALFKRFCDIYEKPSDYADSCRGKVMASLFYEPSTRTNFSFQSAMLRLGGGTFGFSDPSGSSVSKGETLADTIRITASYADTIVIRSPLEGAAAAAALYSEVPLINAGDGGHFHPTQTLADLTTIAQKCGSPDGLRIGLCGDLKYGRTVHSLISALSMFSDVSFYLISPKELKIPGYMREQMSKHGHAFIESENLNDCISELDILYMTRIQRERFSEKAQYERHKGVYVLTKELMNSASPDMLVMHPLPRLDEIDRAIDSDPRAVYFEQARYGMFIRMALLLDFCHKPRMSPSDYTGLDIVSKCHNSSCVTSYEAYLPDFNKTSERCWYCDKRFEK